MDRTRRVPFQPFTTMIAVAGLLTSIASQAVAREGCAAARLAPTTTMLPEVWRAALDDLIRSTAEPGHPWSCAGGTIDLEPATGGAVLRIARDGEPAVTRQVASPADVLPLGQALLAMPLPITTEVGQPPGNAAPSDTLDKAPQVSPPAPPDAIERATIEGRQTVSSKPARRLLLGGGIDARHVGGSEVGWIGPTVSAALVMGRWLPSISFRQQSSISHGPSFDEFSVAVAVQSRFEVGKLELRAGLGLRGAAVQLDLRRRRGDRSRLEGRIGVMTAVAIPVVRWANVVLAADGEVVGLTREMEGPTDDVEPATFPTYTLGGSACLEVPL